MLMSARHRKGPPPRGVRRKAESDTALTEGRHLGSRRPRARHGARGGGDLGSSRRRDPRTARIARRGKRQRCQRLGRASRARADNAPHEASSIRRSEPARRETRGSPALPRRRAPSPPTPCSRREPGGQTARRKPRMTSWEHVEVWVLAMDGLGGRSRSNVSVVARSRRAARQGDDRVTLARRNPRLTAD
jgi:hypothetical protein